MEVMLLIWDELDDWAHACRHLATSAASEVADVAAPLATALIGTVAAFWGTFRDIFP